VLWISKKNNSYSTEGKKSRHLPTSSVAHSGVDTTEMHETNNWSTRVFVHSMQPCDKATHHSKAWRVV